MNNQSKPLPVLSTHEPEGTLLESETETVGDWLIHILKQAVLILAITGMSALVTYLAMYNHALKKASADVLSVFDVERRVLRQWKLKEGDDWQSEAEFLALPEDLKTLYTPIIQREENHRVVKMSRREVWLSGKAYLIRLPDYAAALICAPLAEAPCAASRPSLTSSLPKSATSTPRVCRPPRTP